MKNLLCHCGDAVKRLKENSNIETVITSKQCLHSNHIIEKLTKKCAFTLAEVLITLGIIGVVAALTIPSLIANYQKTVVENQLKKSYATILNAVTMAQKDYGEIMDWDFVPYRSVSGEDLSSLKDSLKSFSQKYLKSYIRLMKDCGGGRDALNSCYYTWYYTDGQAANYIPSDNYYRFIMNNTAVVHMQYDNYQGEFGGSILLYVDVNGMQKPNAFGKDIFTMRLRQPSNEFGFVGRGESRNNLMNHSSWGCATIIPQGKGTYCGALIQRDSWQITDDYPWFK